MADVITRLKVESQEYDAKIKRAAQGLSALEDSLRSAGKSFMDADKAQIAFTKELGSMETVSKSARGRLGELTQAFTDLSVQYKRLTDEEKQGDFGKALSSSLDQLKVRINDAKADLDGVSKELGNTSSVSNETGGVIDNLASKFGLSAKALTGLGAALAGAKVAFDTIKGAIESTEATHDALARATAVTDNITNQFLRTLATADFTSFINGMQGIIDKTIDAYNAMDEFESYAARFQPWQQAREGEIQTKVAQARAAKAQGDIKRAEQLTNEAKDLVNQLAESTKAYGEKETAGGFATIRALMGGVDITNEQIAWYADPKNWEVAKEKAQEYYDIQKRISELGKDTSLNSYRRPGETTAGYQVRKGSSAREQRELEEMLARDPSLKIAYTFQNLRDSGDSDQAQQFKAALSNIYGNIRAESRIESLRARVERIDGVISHSGGGGSGGNTTSTSEKEVTIQQQIAALEKEAVTASDERLQEIIKTVAVLDKQLALEKEIKDVVHGRSQTLNQPVGDRKAFEQQQMVQFEEAFVNVTPKLSEVNISSFISSLKKQLANAEIGSELYNNLTAQITDAQTLGTLISEAVKRGIDVTQINPQELWAKIFGDNPGDYITEDEWKAIQDKLNEYAKKNPIKVNFETGTSQGSSSGAKEAEEKRSMSIAEISRNVLSVTRSLSDLGVEIPDGLTKVLSTMNIITTILGTINTFMGITATTSALKSIPIIGAFLHNGGVVHAANGFSGIVPGTQYSGDQVPAMLDAGEVVLNRAQAGTVASLLTAPQGGNVGRSIATVESDQIKLVLMNGAQSRGMTLGQYLEL